MNRQSSFEDPALGAFLDTEIQTSGWAVVDIEQDDFTPQDLRLHLGSVAARLSLDQSTPPEVTPIYARQPGLKSSLATTRESMDLHTDNVYLETPCRTVLLYCAQPAEAGGASVLVDAKAAFSKLSEETIEALKSPRWVWNNQQHGEQCTPRSVLSGDGSIRWWTLGLQNKDPADKTIVKEVMNALKHDQSYQRFALKLGQLLVIDNQRMVHGRTSFTGERRLVRARAW